MSKTELVEVLLANLSISEKFAASAAERLINCGEPKYLDSVIQFAKSGNRTFLAEGKYDTNVLQSMYQMDYLNAVLMLVWIKADPQTALSALDSGFDDIVG